MPTLVCIILMVIGAISVLWYGAFFLYLRPYRCNVPGPFPLPLVGNWLQVLWPPRPALEPSGDRRIECYWLGVLGTKPIVFVCDPDLVQEIAIDRRDDLHDRGMGDMAAFMAAGSKESILTSRGDLWKRQRSELVPQLTSKDFADDFFDVCLRQSDALISALASEQQAAQTRESCEDKSERLGIATCPYAHLTNASEILHDHLSAATAKGLFGFDDPANHKEQFQAGFECERKDRYTSYWAIMATLPLLPFSWWRRIAGLPWLRRVTKHHEMETLAKDHARIAARELESCIRDDKGTALLDAVLTLRQQDVSAGVEPKLIQERSIANLVGLFNAASKNEAATVCYILVELGLHPKIQNRLYQDIVDTFGTAPPNSRKQLLSIPYLDAVITEALRLNPAFPVIPKIAERDTQLGGYRIGKGSEVAIRASHLQTNPKYWERANEFDPDRHIGETQQPQRPYTYLPFGVGRRQCPGSMIARIAIAIHVCRIIQRFHVEVPDPRSLPHRQVSMTISYRGATCCDSPIGNFRRLSIQPTSVISIGRS